jgi:Peptidase family M28/PA domain
MRTGLALALASFLATRAVAQTSAPGNDEIRKEALRADLFFLASDAMRGRLTEQPENRIAALYIESRFQRAGLVPMGPEKSFFQRYVLSRSKLGGANALSVRRSPGVHFEGRPLENFYPQSFSASGTAEGEVVFVGFGIHAPKLGHDDYSSDAVRGKIALVLDHEPGEKDPSSPFDGVVTSEYSRDLRKALYAQNAGAVGILFVSDIENHEGEVNFTDESRQAWPDPPRRIPRYNLERWVESVRIPALAISPSLAATILDGSGHSLPELSAAVAASGEIAPVAIPSLEVALTADVQHEGITDQNVVAAIVGSDPQRRSDWVIVSAHYDHDGADGAHIFNGADDDGSGTVALLAIADAYAAAARRGARPKRSVLFAAWNSEERGLLGAWAYAESPIVPLRNTVAVLNMDMIGRNEEVPEGGGRRFRGLEVQTAESNKNAVNILGQTYSADLKSDVEEANRFVELELRMRYDNNESNLLRRSDQWPFLQKGVPSLFFHTGLHPDYHTEFDVPDKINYDKLERIARLVHQMSWDLAESDARPRFDKPERAAAVP